jgi:hypothetical protein
MHDPFQSYSPLGTYPGVTNPFQSPYQTLQNPLAAYNPIAAMGISPFAQGGISPQHWQLASLAAQQAAIQQLHGSPWQNPYGYQNPLFQNPLLQNPLLQAILTQQNPYAHAGLQQQWGQIQPQMGPYGNPLAPQTFIGQGGPFGGQFGQYNPLLAQLGARGLQGGF